MTTGIINQKPNTTVRLHHGVPISLETCLFPTFSSLENQEVYFDRTTLVTISNVRYNNKTGSIRLDISPEVLERCNMISWANTGYENRTVYAVISDYKRVSDGAYDVFYKIDWFNTYIDKFKGHATVIEREHLSEEKYNLAMADPFNPNIIEMYSQEDINVPEHFYEDLSSDRGQVAPTGDSGKHYIIMQLTPFEAYDEDSARLTNEEYKKELKALDDKYGVSARQKDPATDAAVEATTGGDIFKKVAVRTVEAFMDIPNIIDAFTGVVNGDFAKYNAEKNALRAKYKTAEENRQRKEDWDDFLDLFQQVKAPSLSNGTINPCYTMALPYSSNGLAQLNSALDWLTIRGFAHSILSIYVLPFDVAFPDGVNLIEVVNPIQSNGESSNVRHPKLCHAPFSYIQVQSPDGNKREYTYENFRKGKGRFAFVATMNGAPSMAVSPIGYRYKADRNIMNMSERVEYSNFPQMPYSTDAYLAFMSKQMQEGLMNRSVPAQVNLFSQRLSNASQVANSVAGGVLTAGSMGGTGAFQAVSSMGGIPQVQGAIAPMMNTMLQDMKEEQTEQIIRGNAPTDLWGNAKPAFALNDYHAGSSGGHLPYLFNRMTFRLDPVFLRPEFIKIYEQYFDLYGYKSLRLGVPYVYQWMRGENVKPHFEEVDGYQTTYVKTENFMVTDVFAPAASFIEAMFNGGVRFVNGDEL